MDSQVVWGVNAGTKRTKYIEPFEEPGKVVARGSQDGIGTVAVAERPGDQAHSPPWPESQTLNLRGHLSTWMRRASTPVSFSFSATTGRIVAPS